MCTAAALLALGFCRASRHRHHSPGRSFEAPLLCIDWDCAMRQIYAKGIARPGVYGAFAMGASRLAVHAGMEDTAVLGIRGASAG